MSAHARSNALGERRGSGASEPKERSPSALLERRCTICIQLSCTPKRQKPSHHGPTGPAATVVDREIVGLRTSAWRRGQASQLHSKPARSGGGKASVTDSLDERGPRTWARLRRCRDTPQEGCTELYRLHGSLTAMQRDGLPPVEQALSCKPRPRREGEGEKKKKVLVSLLLSKATRAWSWLSLDLSLVRLAIEGGGKGMPLFTPTCIRSHGRCMQPMRWIAIASGAGDGEVQRKDAINSGNLTRWDRHGRVQRHSIPRLRQGRPLALCPHAFPRRAAGGTDLGGIDGMHLELACSGGTHSAAPILGE